MASPPPVSWAGDPRWLVALERWGIFGALLATWAVIGVFAYRLVS